MNKCTDRSVGSVTPPRFDRPTNGPTNGPTNTDRVAHREVTPPIIWDWYRVFIKYRVLQKITSQFAFAFRALKVSYSDIGEEGVAVNCEKTQYLMNTLYFNFLKVKKD